MSLTKRIPSEPGRDALRIWQAGVAAVDSATLVRQQVQTTPEGLTVAGQLWISEPDSRICVVGAGKAGAGMAAGLEQALSSTWLSRTSGWLNVPEDCIQPLQAIHLHGARPAGVNEPTAAGVAGTQEILRRVENLHQRDLCLVLISGGGSALLPAPVAGITLEQKLEVTRTFMRGGATIDELNCVRTALSQVKGGGLLRACRAGTVLTLVISDVVGDPLETIASGPTIDRAPDYARAWELVQRFYSAARKDISSSLNAALIPPANVSTDLSSVGGQRRDQVHGQFVIGNSGTAVAAARSAAIELGYHVESAVADQAGDADCTGRQLARELITLGRGQPQKVCVISGGETTVQLAETSGPQKGGRNQQLALAALCELMSESSVPRLALVSGGTDGEDGPTDAAGALLESSLLDEIRQGEIEPVSYLCTNNSYPFWDDLGLLIKSGPTHTNVMDLRIGLVDTQS